MVREKNIHPQDRRQYKRLEHIFPVEFRFLDTSGSPVSEWYKEETEFLLSQSERKTETLERRLLEVSQDDREAIDRLKGTIDLFKKYQDKIRQDLSGLVAKKIKVDGDATIATDTYAWSITAVGPQALKDSGMDPDGIMDFALTQCSVLVEYKKQEGSFVNVKGFDFAKHQNLARGGVVSCEWTAQMILALKIMAGYHQGRGHEEKVLYYSRLGDEYTSELSKMIVSSPSPVGQGDFCLPYASHEFADTGHGWRTPKGSRTGSVAATAYTVLAIDGFNPLRFNG